MSTDELTCPRCQGSHIRKNGRSRHGHQRYVCVSCKATFGQEDHRRVDPALREDALRHYAEGVGLRATERLVGPSHNSIMRWVRQEVAGKALAKLDEAQVQYVEADELWSYAGQKKIPSGCGGLLIVLPTAYSAGRWAIVTPEQPKRWVRKFLAAITSATTPTIGKVTAPSFQHGSTPEAKRTPTTSKA